MPRDSCKDSLGDRMKVLESSSESILNKNLPVLMRLDGRHFHSFTKGLNRPFDESLSKCMSLTTQKLLKESGGVIGYTQSDEITIVILPGPDLIFNGRVQKICSSMAAMASVIFNHYVSEFMGPLYSAKFPTFDCRTWNVPSLAEAANSILWREIDAEKNSILAYALSFFSEKELYRINCDDKKIMLRNIGKPWEDLPVKFRRGIYIKRVNRHDTFTGIEIEKLPIKHKARTDPSFVYQRTIIEEVEFPRLLEIKNVSELLFSE